MCSVRWCRRSRVSLFFPFLLLWYKITCGTVTTTTTMLLSFSLIELRGDLEQTDSKDDKYPEISGCIYRRFNKKINSYLASQKRKKKKRHTRPRCSATRIVVSDYCSLILFLLPFIILYIRFNTHLKRVKMFLHSPISTVRLTLPASPFILYCVNVLCRDCVRSPTGEKNG